MRVEKVSYENIKPLHRLQTINFGSRKSKLLIDSFEYCSDAIVTSLNQADIVSGKFGTQCKGSKPLENFFSVLKKKELQDIRYQGQATNDGGMAFSFLKTKDTNPISTSEAYDCSVMYLHNQNTRTHFLYHIYRTNRKREIDFLLENCMSEGFTSAALVPGESGWKARISCYLPEIFNALKENNPKAPIRIYHYSSDIPEIVGYKGHVFEIKNKNAYMSGQATFPIYDIKTFCEFGEIGKCNSLEELSKIEEKFEQASYDNEVKKILNRLIEKRKSILLEIENCPTKEKIDILTKKYTFEGIREMGDLDYSEAIELRRQHLQGVTNSGNSPNS